MNCPSCGFANEAAAQACNLCGKLLIAKPAPPAPPAAPVPSRAVAAIAEVATLGINSAPGRVPSWPNQAILCFLSMPALTLIATPFLLHKGENEGPDGLRLMQFLWMWISGAVCLVATVPLAARMAFAPLFATVIGGLLFLCSWAFNPGLATLSWIILGGIGLAWVGRSGFTRPWDPGKFLGWTRAGYKRLLAPDRWAVLRLTGGIVLFLGGVGFMIAAGTVVGEYIPISKPVAKFLAIPAFIGGFVAASALSFTEPRESE